MLVSFRGLIRDVGHEIVLPEYILEIWCYLICIRDRGDAICCTLLPSFKLQIIILVSNISTYFETFLILNICINREMIFILVLFIVAQIEDIVGIWLTNRWINSTVVKWAPHAVPHRTVFSQVFRAAFPLDQKSSRVFRISNHHFLAIVTVDDSLVININSREQDNFFTLKLVSIPNLFSFIHILFNDTLLIDLDLHFLFLLCADFKRSRVFYFSMR